MLSAPEGVLQAQREPPVGVAATLQATTVTRPPSSSYVFAFPRVIAGWATLAAQGNIGDMIVLDYGENCCPAAARTTAATIITSGTACSGRLYVLISQQAKLF